MVVGLIMFVVGVGLAAFTDVVSDGGFILPVLLIAIGMILLAPSKIYLTFKMMEKNDKKLR